MVLQKVFQVIGAVALAGAVAVPAALTFHAATPNEMASAITAPELAPTLSPATIRVGESLLPFVDTFEATTAPETGAGLWMGSDSTTDGSWGYFIGHNPGPFHAVMGLVKGDPVTICDRQGHTRTYHVVDTFRVTDDTYWETIEDKVTGYGESAILQTCCGDDAHYRIVVCA
ncbi:MAG: sortase [Eggerthellaceae bacterium]|nr:sortase [Eggerthellaceae bacterium]